jgi:hypothetical protein
MNADISSLSREQEAQVRRQWEAHQGSRTEVDIPLAPGVTLERLAVHRGVWNPAITSARYFARWLYEHREKYEGRCVLDMGTGSGIAGIVMAMHGAEYAMLADTSLRACANAIENMYGYGLERKADVVQSDLFNKLGSLRYDLMYFAQPFFPGTPSDDTIEGSMLAPPSTINSFLFCARYNLNENGLIVMPSYDLAGPANDPAVRGPEHGYEVVRSHPIAIDDGIQRGQFYMHELVYKGVEKPRGRRQPAGRK